MKRIFIGHDFFGAGNFGDDLMLDGFLRTLDDSGARAGIIACTPHDIASQQRRFPSIRWLPSSYPLRERALRDCHVWLGLGGTPFQCASGPWSLDHLDRERELCRRLGKPMVFLGVGCEGSAAVQDVRSRRVIQTAERIWTRDLRSAEEIGRFAQQGVVDTGADLAHVALAATIRAAPEPGTLGLLLAFETPGTVDLRAVERQISRRRSGTTRWLVQETRSFPCTELWNYADLSSAAKDSLRLMPMNYSTDTLQQFLGNFGAPEPVLSSRYHGALIAAWHGCRLAVIARSEKLAGIVADLDVPSVDRAGDSRELEALVHDAVRVDAARLQTMHGRAVAMCRSFLGYL